MLLLGESSAISGWLMRLRTHYVDVNAKGLNCKERKSTVLSRGPPPPPPGGGWRQMLAAEGEGTERDGGARHWVQQRYVSVTERAGINEGNHGGNDTCDVGGGRAAPLLSSPGVCFDALGLRALFDECVVTALLPGRAHARARG